MSENLLPSRPWKTFTDNSIGAVGLKLAYPYKDGSFYLDISQASLNIGDRASAALRDRTMAAVWFAGNFNYQLHNDNAANKIQSLQTMIQQWKTDLNQFGNFISQKFLS